MFDLLKPEIRVESEGLDYVHIVAEPLEKGFGNTVGNALRRVLLASLSMRTCWAAFGLSPPQFNLFREEY